MRFPKLLAGLPLLSLSLSACGPADEPALAPAQVEVGVSKGLLRAAQPVAGQYIVVLSDRATGDVRAQAEALSRAHGGEVFLTYEHALRGFAVRMSEASALALTRNPLVAYVEEDGVVGITATQDTTPNSTINFWGLDRADQRSLPLSETYTYASSGTGVHAYIIDSGILIDHQDFEGRASADYTSVNDRFGAGDCNGHGSHVAGTVGGKFSGIAKSTRLHSVRVLDCNGSGTTSGVVGGIDWVRANAIKPAVANMSLGGGASSTLDSAVSNLISSGVTVVVAAGNSNVDASNTSPARVTAAITVGATTSSDARASFSNFGSVLDLFAPGEGIWSVYHARNNKDTALYTSLSGTSMASPLVAGIAARYLESNPTASPSAVANFLTSNATTGELSNIGSGSPNLLAYIDSAF